MTTLENFYFGNINPSDYRQSVEVNKKLSAIINLIEELSALTDNVQQEEKIARLEEIQTELIALAERDAYIEGLKLGVKMTTEIYTDK